MSLFVDRYLEDPGRMHIRSSLLGSLAENLMTIGKVAGRFITCESCGTTVLSAGAGLVCETCSNTYELKPDPNFRSKNGVMTRFLVREIHRLGVGSGNDWFIRDENWSVADFFCHFMRLPMSAVLTPFLEGLDVSIPAGSRLEHAFFWPRLFLGCKTIQPDATFVFDRVVVHMEFKRPLGAPVEPRDVAGYLAFCTKVAAEIGLDWRLVFVPGPASRKLPQPEELIRAGRDAIDDATENYRYDPSVGERVRDSALDHLLERVRVRSWEELFRSALDAAALADPEEWTHRDAIRALQDAASSRGFRIDQTPVSRRPMRPQVPAAD